MRSIIIAYILVCARCTAAPNVLKQTWDILLRSGYTESRCPELTEPPYAVNIAHESDCGKFYICQRGKKIEMVCASFLEFNEEIKICDWPQNANCLLEKRSGYIDDTDSESTETRIVKKKEVECNEDRQIPHKGICNQYYRCVYGQKVLKICSDNMVFNRDLARCDFKYNVVCGSLSIIEQPTDEKGEIIYDDLGDYDYYDDFLEDNSDQYSDGNSNQALLTNECPDTLDTYDVPVLLPHEERCNAYYRCFNGKKQLMFCPGVFQFNPEFKVCDWPDRVTCEAGE